MTNWKKTLKPFMPYYPDSWDQQAINSEPKTDKAPRKLGRKTKKILFIALVSISLAVILSQSLAFVPAGYRGVFLTFGAVDENRSIQEGIVGKIPFVNDVVPVEVRKKIHTDTTGAASKDLQDVSTTVTVEYRINPDTVQLLWKRIGPDYETRIIAPAIKEITKQVTANFVAEQLITERAKVKDAIEQGIHQRLLENDLFVSQVSITDFQFSDLFTAAIESKVEAQQKALKAENDLKRIKVEAQQAEAQAIGTANANIARANGEAQAINIINEQLTKSPSYMEWLKTQKWNGILPLVVGSDATPFINIPSGNVTGK